MKNRTKSLDYWLVDSYLVVHQIGSIVLALVACLFSGAIGYAWCYGYFNEPTQPTHSVVQEYVQLLRIDPQYVYKMEVLNVVDGDTFDVRIDLGFKTLVEHRIRLLGVNCPETSGTTKKQGDRATEATKKWLQDRTNFIIRTKKEKKKQTDSFGRYLGEVYGDYQGRQESLGLYLLANGYATEFME